MLSLEAVTKKLVELAMLGLWLFLQLFLQYVILTELIEATSLSPQILAKLLRCFLPATQILFSFISICFFVHKH